MDPTVVEAFLGRVKDPPPADSAAGSYVLRDAALRVIMFTDLKDSTAMTTRLGETKALHLRRIHNAFTRNALESDTSAANPAARLQLNVLGAVAEFEREIIRERVNDDIAAAKTRGVRFGRPETLNAHRDDIARLRVQGKSGRAIAAELGIPVGSVFQVFNELNRIAKAA